MRVFRLFLLLLLISLPFSDAYAGGGVDLHRETAKVFEEAWKKLAEVAERARQAGLPAEAEGTAVWLRPGCETEIRLPVLPSQVGTLAPKADLPENVSAWHEQFVAVRRETAEALFLIARRAVKEHQASLAFELVLLALEQDPDHEGARRVLGFSEYEGHWRNAYEIRKLRGGYVWDSRFGWILRSRLPRYEKGERYFKGRWISKEEDDRLHLGSSEGWKIATRHYQISTNHSREMGVRLGEKLEEFHLVWKLLFIRYYATEAQVTALFNERSKAAPVSLPRHRVVFYRTKQDYVNALKRYFPNQIEGTLGVYVDRARTAFFFLDENRDGIRTLYHEATHQLFHESRPVARAVGARYNFWIVEGVALYMESLRRRDGYYTLGGFDDQRMIAARHRLLKDRFYIPFQTLTSFGMARLQGDRNLPMIYSQMTGLTHFLVHGGQGRYRDALIEYLRTVYEGRDTPLSLQELTQTPYPVLDRQYREFMQKGGSSRTP